MNKNYLKQDTLVGHWPFNGDVKDHSGTGLSVENYGVELNGTGPDGKAGTAARFNGRDAHLKIPHHPALNLGKDGFSIAVWIHTEEKADVVGDIVGKFDDITRKGFNLNVVSNTGVTSTAQSNYRNLHFGIDNSLTSKEWGDCGRPGNAVFIQALSAVNGSLYAGTFEFEKNEKGHLWRYAGGQQWIDCGSPDGANSVTGIIEYKGSLYCCTGRYDPSGSRWGGEPVGRLLLEYHAGRQSISFGRERTIH